MYVLCRKQKPFPRWALVPTWLNWAIKTRCPLCLWGSIPFVSRSILCLWDSILCVSFAHLQCVSLRHNTLYSVSCTCVHCTRTTYSVHAQPTPYTCTLHQGFHPHNRVETSSAQPSWDKCTSRVSFAQMRVYSVSCKCRYVHLQYTRYSYKSVECKCVL